MSKKRRKINMSDTPRTDEAWKKAEAACFHHDEETGTHGSYESVAVRMLKFARTLELELESFRAPKRSHDFWYAGQPDCPLELKAGGELHTLKCKVCGEENPRSDGCSPKVWRDASCQHCNGTGNGGSWVASDSVLPNV